MVKLAASLAAAPLERLGEAISELERAGADYIHFDVEDGVFVPVMTLGTRIIPALRSLTSLPFDVHLMMVNPEWLLPDLARWGANRVAVHLEACPYPLRVLQQIVSLGMQAGLALNPITPLPDLAYLQPYLSYIILLTTEPSEQAQFLPAVLEKLHEGKSRSLTGIEWVVDGGITPENAALAVQAGADTLVVGRAVFDQGRVAENLRALRQASAACTPGTPAGR